MGKWTDKLYITHGEWKSGEFRGGLSKARQNELCNDREFKRLPFDHCALSLKPFIMPVCTFEGVVFNFEEIERFLRLSDDPKCPVTGRPLKLSDLIRLHFHRNAAGEYSCPVTGRVFSDASKIMANRRTGRVYSAEAVDEMIATGVDFCTDQPCCKPDFLCILDPSHLGSVRNIALRTAKDNVIHPEYVSQNSESIDTKNLLIQSSTGRMAASLTSTAMTPIVKQTLAQVNIPSVPLRNAEIVIRTTHGDMETILYAPLVPVAVYNFLHLAKKGAFCNVPIHRIIPNYCFLSGITDAVIPCQLEESPADSLQHDSPGIIGMCSGEEKTSQFYVTLAPLPEYDGENVVVGRILLDRLNTERTFRTIESVNIDAHGTPLEYCSIVDIIVMRDPFTRADEAAMRTKPVQVPRYAQNKTNQIGRYLKL